MSKVFYDHLIKFEKLEVHINSITSSHEEKSELWDIVDKLVHNRIIKKILGILPKRHHDEFSELLHRRPYDEQIINYLEESADQDIEEILRKEIHELEIEILKELQEDGQEL